MALKRQFDMSATFSMASMTDVIFLLLIFFMVTSTFVFPNALEVNLPESESTTALKPAARVYLDSLGRTAAMYGEGGEWQMIDDDTQLRGYFDLITQQELAAAQTPADSAAVFVALYADRAVDYGRVVDILNLGTQNSIKVVLATQAPATEPNLPAPADGQ